MKKLYLYVETGANQANEVENTLQAYDVNYNRIYQHQFADFLRKLSIP